MYFHSRQQAGRMLASRLIKKYRYENCIVVALDDGGAVIGSEIAAQLHCGLNITVAEEISLPREPWAVGGITPDGQFVTNSQYTDSELSEMQEENRGYIEEQKINKFREINRLFSHHGEVVDRRLLSGRNVILTSDGLPNAFKLDAANAFIKIASYVKLVVATPIASVSVVDWMHIHADDIYCLSVLTDYIDTDHYYDIKDIPPHDKIIEMINSNVLKWH
jgi:putative phosphoribosyl transferase